MVGYVTLGTNDIRRAAAFYDALLGSIGAKRLMEIGDFILWGTDFETASLMLRGFSGSGEMGEVEMLQFYARMQRFFRDLEALFVYSGEGGIHEWGAQGWRVAASDFLTFPGVLGYWEHRRHWYSQAFQSEVDRLKSDARAVMAEAYAARLSTDDA